VWRLEAISPAVRLDYFWSRSINSEEKRPRQTHNTGHSITTARSNFFERERERDRGRNQNEPSRRTTAAVVVPNSYSIPVSGEYKNSAVSRVLLQDAVLVNRRWDWSEQQPYE
jgi:hypothetical protein